METAPRHLDLDEIRRSLAELPAVLDVHDLHVWTIGNGEVALSSHIVACRGAEASSLLAQMNRRLRERFEIGHVTIQIEPEGSGDGRSLSESDAVCSGGCPAARLAAGCG